MSKAYLANKHDLQNLLEQYPEKTKYFAKYSAFIGDSDAIDYITEQIKLHNESILNIGHKDEGLAS